MKEYPEKIKSIVDEISKLTLLEVADLNELLKVIQINIFLGLKSADWVSLQSMARDVCKRDYRSRTFVAHAKNFQDT